MAEIKTKINKKLRFLVTGLVILGLAVAGLFLVFQYNSRNLISKADNSAAYGTGQVSIDKKYFNGNAEVDSLTVNTSSSITVRLKYNNTGTITAPNVRIQDSIPSGFSLVTGSLKNCYSDLTCVNLNDNLFASGNLVVAPGAGYFGYGTDNSTSTSNLEMGRKKYIKITRCQDSTGEGDWYSPSGSDGAGGTLGTSNSVTAVTLAQMQANEGGYCNASGSTFLNGVFLARGKRYIHEVKCSSATGIPYFGDWKIPLNVNSQSVSLGVSNYSTALTQSDILYGTPSYCTQSGRTFVSQALDLSGNRYIHQIKCVDPVNFGDMYIPGNSDGAGGILGLSNTSTLLTISRVQQVDPSFCTGSGQTFTSNVQDTLDTANGYGYVEYRITAPSYGGLFGADATMSGGFSASAISDPAQFSISVGTDLKCPYLNPANGTRMVNLGDAELRTDQDFTCNYVAKICFTVFQDDNIDGIQNGSESRVAGVTVKVYSQDGLTEIYSTTSNSSGLQCFEPLQNSLVYLVKVINPPTPYSTTGGDQSLVGITYQSGVRNINFGYGTGSLSFSTERTVTLGNLQISAAPQNVCTTIHDIQVIDTRLNKPGWSVLATVDNFVDITNTSNTILSAGRVELTPKTITVVSGSDTGLSPGQRKTIASTSDTTQVFSGASSYGFGTYKTNMDLCLTVPPFSKLGQYQSIVHFTV